MTFLSALIVVPVIAIFTGTFIEKIAMPAITFLAS